MIVRPSGPCPARIMIVGEAPGGEEERQGVPFVGASGAEFTKMLFEAGISRAECFITNVIRVRPPNNDLFAFIAKAKKDITPQHTAYRDKMVKMCVIEGVKMLRAEIAACDPNLIIAAGNLAMWTLTGKWGITDWRGSVLRSDLDERYKVLCTYHPAAILRQWSWRATLVQDLRRGVREAEFRDLVTPRYNFILSPSIRDVLEILEWLLARANIEPLLLSVDIETKMHFITCIGIAWSKLSAICIPFTSKDNEDGYWSSEEEALIIHRLSVLFTHPNVRCVGQNFLYDAQHILKWWHFLPRVARDTMLAQHVCFPGLPKSLAFIASCYCEHYRYWKDSSIYADDEKQES